MTTISFTFRNTQQDQTIQVLDRIDTTKNPIFSGPLNNGQASDPIQCWADTDGHGNVLVRGDASAGMEQTIDRDGYTFDYSAGGM